MKIEFDQKENLFPELVKAIEENQIPVKKQHQFVAGKSGNPKGRPKNAIGIKTKIIKEFTENIISENISAFRENLKSLKGKDHVNAMIALLDYSIPRQNRTSFVDETEKKEQVEEIFIIGGKE